MHKVICTGCYRMVFERPLRCPVCGRPQSSFRYATPEELQIEAMVEAFGRLGEKGRPE